MGLIPSLGTCTCHRCWEKKTKAKTLSLSNLQIMHISKDLCLEKYLEIYREGFASIEDDQVIS